MFTIHYVILAHKDPVLVSRLIRNLNAENVRFYIHIDSKSKIEAFVNEIKKTDIKAFWVRPGYEIKWGHINIVRATLEAFRAIELKSENDRIVLLSGQDFPIKSTGYISEYFRNNQEKIFIEGEAFPVQAWGETSFDRISNYHVFRGRRGWIYSLPHISSLKEWRKLPFSKKKWALLFIWKVLRERKFPSYVKPFGGSQWFSVNGYGLKYILQFLEDHPGYIRYHIDTRIPDEIFFQSILFSSSDEKISSAIINSNHHYIDWSERDNKFPPATLDSGDFGRLAASDKLFCRKVDSISSFELLNRIESELL
jgi:hypothetical protein